MAELSIVSSPEAIEVTFSLEPALNVVNSLHLLNATEQYSGFGEWIYQTAAALPPERLRTNELVFGGLSAEVHVLEGAWPSFTAWLDDLAAHDPYALRDYQMAKLSEGAEEMLGEAAPTPEQLLADRAAYLALIERLHCCKEAEETYDVDLYQEAHALLNDPPAMQDLAVTHFRTMWDEVTAAEWKRNLPLLQESAAAFQTLDFAGLSCAEILRRVTGRDLSAKCEEWREQIDQIVFIPSAHIGPYVATVMQDEIATARIIFGARVPKGVAVASPALGRSELLMRLSALADDTRLRILELLAGGGESSSQEIMERLDLSQSAASRHLRQLAATGYLQVRRQEGAKLYSLNSDRIDETFGALKRSVH